MRKVVVVAVVLAVLAVVGTYAIGYFGTGSVDSYPSHAETQEVEAFRDALRKGEMGPSELQELMKSPDDMVGALAALELFDGPEEGARMFFEKLPEVSAGVLDLLRSGTYSDQQYKLAAKEVGGPEGAARDGAALFLLLPETRAYLNRETTAGIGDALVGAIPTASGGFADELAATIGLYRPSSLDGLKKHLGSGDERVRLIAVQALGLLWDAAAISDVSRMQFDPDIDVRKAALVALANLRTAVDQTVLESSEAASEPADPEPAENSAKKRLGMP